MLRFFVVWGALVLLWWLVRHFAAQDHFLTVEQMRSHGIRFHRGIPWEGHVACRYLDLWTFPVVMALWAGFYGDRWSLLAIVICTIAGFALSAVMHLTYIDAGKNFPEFVTYAGELKLAGVAHVVYMGLGFALVLLAFTSTKNPAPALVWLTTVYLIIHVTLGVHVIYKVWTPDWFPYRGVLDAGTLGPIVGSTVVLLGATWWALR